jgi:hypothetical protein
MSKSKKPGKFASGTSISEEEFAKILVALDYPGTKLPHHRAVANAWEVGVGPFTEEQFNEIMHRAGITIHNVTGAKCKVTDFLVYPNNNSGKAATAPKGIPSSTKVGMPVVGLGAAVEGNDMVQATAVISSPPGAWMEAIASTVFSPKTKERIFDQILADFRQEYFDILSKRASRERMFFVVARHWIGFVMACLIEAASGIGNVWKRIRGG